MARRQLREMDVDGDGFVSVDEYLHARRSKGERERVTTRSHRRSEADSFETFDLDIKVLLAILRQRSVLRHIACIPDVRLCLYRHSHTGKFHITHDTARRDRCPRYDGGASLWLDGACGIMVTSLWERRPRLWLPRNILTSLTTCERDGYHFVVSNFGLYHSTDLSEGHANCLLFNLKTHTIERYEPVGRLYSDDTDRTIKRLFRAQARGWKYVGTQNAAPLLGPQAIGDSYHGMCVTFTIYFMLVRLLNPDKTPAQIYDFLVRGSARQIRSRALRLNKWVIEKLRRYERGELEYGPTPPPRPRREHRRP